MVRSAEKAHIFWIVFFGILKFRVNVFVMIECAATKDTPEPAPPANFSLDWGGDVPAKAVFVDLWLAHRS
jgi:hypothetical protein